jgi:hypothetical protein
MPSSATLGLAPPAADLAMLLLTEPEHEWILRRNGKEFMVYIVVILKSHAVTARDRKIVWRDPVIPDFDPVGR